MCLFGYGGIANIPYSSLLLIYTAHNKKIAQSRFCFHKPKSVQLIGAAHRKMQTPICCYTNLIESDTRFVIYTSLSQSLHFCRNSTCCFK